MAQNQEDPNVKANNILKHFNDQDTTKRKIILKNVPYPMPNKAKTDTTKSSRYDDLIKLINNYEHNKKSSGRR